MLWAAELCKEEFYSRPNVMEIEGSLLALQVIYIIV